MKLTVAVLALLCFSIGANASSDTLGVKLNKTAAGVHVELPDITVPKVTMPEVNVAVEVKKPALNMATIDLPDFTIPTIPNPLDGKLQIVSALISKAGNSTARLAGLLKKSDVDLSALQGAVNAALQKQASMTAEAAGALQTLATAVYQAKYNVTSKIADMALEALSKRPSMNLQLSKPEIDPAALIGALLQSKFNVTMPDINMPTVDLSALQALLSKKIDVQLPNVDLSALHDQLAALLSGNITLDKQMIDMAGLQSSLAQLASLVEKPNIDINGIVNAISAQRAATAEQLLALLQQKKNVGADLVGMLNAMKQPKAVNLTIPTIQFPRIEKPNVDIASIINSVSNLKNVTASIAADEIKLAAILSWLRDSGFYQLRDAAGSGKGAGSVTINLGKEGASGKGN